jgi:hypothetical protein
MKKQILISALALLLIVFNTNAQIKIITGGNVGVGFENPLQKLHINGAIRGNQTAGALDITTDYGYTRIGAMNTSCTHIYTALPQFYFSKKINLGDGLITSYTGYNLQLCTSSNFTYRMTILSSNGYVGIGYGYTNPSYMLDVNGIVRATSYQTSSDIRLKKDVTDLPSASVNNIFNLNAITYKHVDRNDIDTNNANAKTTSDTTAVEPKPDKNREKKLIGFSAQEVQKLFPDLVCEDEQGYLSLDYIGLIPVLVEAIKQQQVKIAELEKKVSALSATKPK